uniref:ER lumen protein-retaining receptor n=1 Tax=Helicotheca tamesis TaxID=374047 RepID=A0A7S2H1C4_9STRA|mmetsp:Transcript_14310/g.19567  ORF Transcript_14310/g.19567 Transcript_14310/m.19567 type:complete len:300 (+) Transcript_14310:178-1077(+)
MSMNIFRLTGDSLHMLSHSILIIRLLSAKNAQAISLKSIELYLLIYVSRYLDLFTTFYTWYNSIVKIFYILTSIAIVYIIRHHEPNYATYDRAHDTFAHWKLAVIPCAFVAIIATAFRQILDAQELILRFSIYLESVAMLPQLVLLEHYQEIECLTGSYIGLKSCYRGFYILNWVYRSYYTPFYWHHPVVYIAGVLQTVIGACILVELRNKAWKPKDLFVRTTYTQPRLSRLQDEEDNNQQEAEGSRNDENGGGTSSSQEMRTRKAKSGSSEPNDTAASPVASNDKDNLTQPLLQYQVV